MSRLVLFLLLAFPAAAAPKLVNVEIHAAPANSRWRATYRFDSPVDRVVFSRQGEVRRTAWRVETAGYSIVDEKGVEALVRKKGMKERREINLSFPFDTTHPEKDYQLFQSFSDGSVLLYTGHFGLDGTRAAFQLKPRRGEHIVVGGRVQTGRFRWIDPDPQGTFIYFGKIRPVETPEMIAVLDPGTPAWLTERLHKAVPGLFADYVRLTGVALENRPTILFSFKRAADPNSTTWKGGTLTGLIQMHIEADPNGAENRDLLERFFKFLAHEAAHLWNGQLFHNRQPNQSWLHEGSADAFAWRALRRAGILDDRELLQRQAADLNACLAAIGTESLEQTEKQGSFTAVYTCGSMLAWLSEAAIRKKDPTADLHTLWKALFSAATAREHDYDEALFLSTLEQHAADESASRFIASFLHDTMADRVERTIAAFANEGITLVSSPAEMPPQSRQQWGRNLLFAVMGGDCGGRVSFTNRPNGYALNGAPGCATIRKETLVSRAEGHSLLAEGGLAYDAVAARCAAGQPVRLEGDGIALEVPCTRKLRPRPPWLRASQPEIR